MRVGSRSSWIGRVFVSASLGAASLTAGGLAHGYCRTSTCPGQNPPGTRCEPVQTADCGTALFWPNPCVGFSIQRDASKQVPLETALEVFHTAFETWMNADCGSQTTPRIQLIDFGPAECHEQEYNQHAGNSNIIMFRDDVWPYEGTTHTLALTIVTYNRNNAEIYDADMEINSAQAHITLTTGDSGVQFDLRSIAAHEAGHFLGLAHSTNSDATMAPSYDPGTIDLRTLTADDMAGICAIYPPGAQIPDSCDPTPRHGFSSVCASAQVPETEESAGCCAVAPGSAGRTAAGGIVFAAAALLFGARRRSAGPHRRSRLLSGLRR
jgi:hypothetical protein